MKIKANNSKGFYEFELGGVLDCNYLGSKTRRGRVQDEGRICPTITSNNFECYRIEGRKMENTKVLCTEETAEILRKTNPDDFAIRKLTPRECYRLMDFDDRDFDKAAEVNSNTRLYEQAGNSIVKNCLIAIFGQMFEGKEDMYKKRTQGYAPSCIQVK